MTHEQVEHARRLAAKLQVTAERGDVDCLKGLVEDAWLTSPCGQAGISRASTMIALVEMLLSVILTDAHAKARADSCLAVIMLIFDATLHAEAAQEPFGHARSAD